MNFCEQCGNKFNEGAKFCGKCGAARVYDSIVVEQKPVNEEKPYSPNYAAKADTIPQHPALDKNFVLIESGQFIMGNESAQYAQNYHRPHEENVAKFIMGKYTVTQKEYEKIMGCNPSYFKGDNLPVENICWYDAIDYCNRRSKNERLVPVYAFDEDILGGILSILNLEFSSRLSVIRRFPDVLDIPILQNANGYRLPTSAEWEYACRAGTNTLFNTGDTITHELANFKSNNNPALKTLPVGTFAPNAWGLYDMHGNVNEWCWNPWGGVYKNESREIRGGSWNNDLQAINSYFGDTSSPVTKRNDIGFRVVCSVLSDEETAGLELYETLLNNKKSEIESALEKLPYLVKGMIECTQCGEWLEATEKFCGNCGAETEYSINEPKRQQYEQDLAKEKNLDEHENILLKTWVAINHRQDWVTLIITDKRLFFKYSKFVDFMSLKFEPRDPRFIKNFSIYYDEITEIKKSKSEIMLFQPAIEITRRGGSEKFEGGLKINKIYKIICKKMRLNGGGS